MANKKKEKIEVDIILPNYNSSNYIIKTVNSILNQSYKNWKLIIVDDNSDEKTIKILKTPLESERDSNNSFPPPGSDLNKTPSKHIK